MSELVYVKYCPLCGAENPRQQPFCQACQDGDLSTVAIEPRRDQLQNAAEDAVMPEGDAAGSETPAAGAQAATPSIILELLDDPSVRFAIGEGQSVGRTEKADVILSGVPKLDWISGAHAKFFRRGAQWYAQHIAQTNFIRVDGEQYHGQEEVAIYDGSILVLSLTAFRVKI